MATFIDVMRQIAAENETASAGTEAIEETEPAIESLDVAQKIGNSAPPAEVIQLAVRHGAMPADWGHLDLILGLGTDLLPVVSNPDVTISPDSTVAKLGKVPSRYNARHQVVGFTQWTSYRATPDDITGWAKEKDYGICLQMRQVRAIDVDIDDLHQAEHIRQFIAARHTLPTRTRKNSTKFLLLFECHGEIFKRKFKTAHGIVELLAQGQQAILAGTHPSGVRYEWPGGLPDCIPALSMAQFEQLWSDLVAQFAIEAPSSSSASIKPQKLAEAAIADPVAQYLLNSGKVKGTERDGRMHIECPWEEDHSTDSGESSTTYWPAHTGGYERGGFKCLHAHCEGRSVEDLKTAIGYSDPDDFEGISDDVPAPVTDDQGKAPAGTKFPCIPAHVFASGTFPEWIVEDVLPEAELAMIYGPSGSGKSFFAFDLAASVARGVAWRGLDVKQGRVVYIAAEGANGARMRLRAYAHQQQIELADMPFDIIPAAPNFLIRADAAEVAKSVGKASIIIVDTFAATMLGNENSGDDVGNSLKNLKDIHKHTGALIIVIHHSGKDEAKGARGWSGIRAAMDAEIETNNVDGARAATVGTCASICARSICA